MKRNHYTVQVGKCGLQLGHEYWKEIFSEICLNPSLKKIHKSEISRYKHLFFKEASSGKITPRAVFFDSEPRILNKLQRGTFLNFYSNSTILLNGQNSLNDWASGYVTASKNKECLENLFRKIIEECDQMPYFDIFHSLSGGTGSGSGSYIMEMIKDEFLGKFVTSYSFIPNQDEISNTIIQPYNSVLTIRWLVLYCDSVIFFENNSLEKIINDHDKKIKCHIHQINSLASKIIKTIKIAEIHSLDFENSKENIFIPLIPLPNLHFFVANILNFFTKGERNYITEDRRNSAYFLLNNCTISVPIDNGRLLSSFYISNHILSKNKNYENLRKKYEKNKIKFTEWSPPNIYYSNVSFFSPKKKYNQLEICLTNHSFLKILFKKILIEYDCLKKKNAFLNNYLKQFKSQVGFELFRDARETICSLIEEYNTIDMFLHE